MKENAFLIDSVEAKLKDDELCFCIIGRKTENNMSAQCLTKGDPMDITELMGATILEQLNSDSEEEKNKGLKQFLVIENALIALMAYNDKIYNHVMNHIKEIPGKPIMFAQLNDKTS